MLSSKLLSTVKTSYSKRWVGMVGLWLLVIFPVLSQEAFGQDDEIIHGPSYQLLNFGVVVKNPTYTIYRSALLGNLGLKNLGNFLDNHNLPFPKTIIYMNKTGYAFPFYFAIEEYKDSLSGKYGEFDFYHSFGGLRTYVDGMNPYHPTDVIDKFIYFGITAKRYFAPHHDGIVGGTDAVTNILRIVLDPSKQPVLFHCFGGLHRTGMIGMLLRFLQGGFWVDGPREESHGMSLNPAEQEYTKYNPLIFRKPNVEFVEQFSHDPRFLELQAQYHDALQGDERLFFDDDDSRSPNPVDD